ncbi:uncharacterized protein ACA1_164820 [Acanthamoeba castellanii str. Neff]|uniref:Uncharacterized protein n=1 Tax=Acanthamoeba castellanii (strain ATCC 30010 / Neff) TaxID=1257118 RepID=L8GU38_ACACF|nr:uncharacterized protein ACA1_164820 [Acanthamoeba castellanii str. Neff]ELR15601.1 hypothetical protein ACA1_164820 [Acanthamoeba castellanii str. Neff]
MQALLFFNHLSMAEPVIQEARPKPEMTDKALVEGGGDWVALDKRARQRQADGRDFIPLRSKHSSGLPANTRKHRDRGHQTQPGGASRGN